MVLVAPHVSIAPAPYVRDPKMRRAVNSRAKEIAIPMEAYTTLAREICTVYIL